MMHSQRRNLALIFDIAAIVSCAVWTGIAWPQDQQLAPEGRGLLPGQTYSLSAPTVTGGSVFEGKTTKPIAVFTHHPPFEVTVGPDRLHFETPESMSRLRGALQRSRRVVAVFSGHVHRAAAGHVGRIPASVVPCIATTLRKGEYSPHMRTRPVYHVHRFDPAWGFATETRIVRSDPPATGERKTTSAAAEFVTGG